MKAFLISVSYLQEKHKTFGVEIVETPDVC